MSVRIGVDVGGTFTDIVCFDEQGEVFRLLKVPSTPDQPSAAVIEGTRRVLSQFGVPAESVRFFIHGTTVATNTILERKGAEVALLVTAGFRDVPYIMRQDRPRLYDYFQQRPQPLIPRELRFEVPERMLYTGQVSLPLQEEPTRQLLCRLKGLEVRDIAVCLLHSYVNPSHERTLRDWIGQEIPEARVSLSSDILPEFKEFERLSTTAVNAYVLPSVGSYLRRLEEGLASLKIPSGLHIMQSNGGIMTSETAQSHCVHMVLSGPAAGALSGLVLGRKAGLDHIISIDVGGTSADVAVARDGTLHFAEESEIAGQILKIPAIDINTVGAGGGSIAWVDSGGALQVGPQSAGAHPGPACYRRGGSRPTVTDANVVLGRLNAGYLLGGEMAIDGELSAKAIGEGVASPLGLEVVEAAEGIIRVINAVMAKAIRRLSVEKGYDPREFTLVSFGGGGPLHAAELAADLQIPRVLVPPVPGVSSALGLITADFRHDYVRTVLWKQRQASLGQFKTLLGEMQSAALAQLQKEGVASDLVAFVTASDLRYQGQGFSLPASFDLEELSGWTDLGPLIRRFHQRHQETYGYHDDRAAIEVVNLRLAAIGRLSPVNLSRLPRRQPDPGPALAGPRKIYVDGRFTTANVYRRSGLGWGSVVRGPAIVEQLDSTTLILPGQQAETDEFGNLMITWENLQ